MAADDEIAAILVNRGRRLVRRRFRRINFTGNHHADTLLNDLDHYPHHFVLACIMDRQISAERAWLIPYALGTRIGAFEFEAFSRVSQVEIGRRMREPESLHRFPETMAKNLFAAIRRIESIYGGKASSIWEGRPSSATIVRRFLEFEGAGPKIATMAANILVRDFKVRVSDRSSIDISPDVQVRRVFARLGLTDTHATNEQLIYRAREMFPRYPGIFDLSTWEIGRNWCRPRAPNCSECYMNKCCPTAFTQP